MEDLIKFITSYWFIGLALFAIIIVFSSFLIAFLIAKYGFEQPNTEVAYISSTGKWVVKKIKGRRYLTGVNVFGSYDDALMFDTEDAAHWAKDNSGMFI